MNEDPFHYRRNDNDDENLGRLGCFVVLIVLGLLLVATALS